MKLNIKKWVPGRRAGGCFSILCSVVLLSSCGDKEKATPEVPEPPQKERVVATPEQRAEKLGLLSMVPADAEAVLAVYDLPYMISSVEKSKLAQLFVNEKIMNASPADVDVVEVETEVDTTDLMGNETVTVTDTKITVADRCPVKEFVIAVGPGNKALVDAMVKDYPKLYGVMAQAQMGSMMQMVTGSSMSDSQMQQEMIMKLMSELPNMELVKQLDFSPGSGAAPLIIMAELTPDMITEVKGYVNQAAGMGAMVSGGVVAPYSSKVGELDFTGIAVDGPMLSQMLKAQAGQMGGMIDAKTIDAVAERVAKGKLYLAVAFKGNALIAVLCTNPEKQLVLPAKAADSILSKDDCNFADQYLDKKASSAVYLTPAYTKSMVDLGIAYYEAEKDYMTGMFATLGESGQVDKAAMEKMTGDFADIYNLSIKTLKMYDTSVACTAYAWYDKGLKTEFTMGDNKVYDWSNPVAYSAVCDMPDAWLTYAASITDDYSRIGTEMLETVGRLVWDAVGVVKSTPAVQNPQFDQYYGIAKDIQPGIVQIWDTAKGLQPAFRQQYAVAIDLNGTFPECKDGSCGISPEVAKNGRIPRIAIVQGLADRSKLAPAWESINKTISQYTTKYGLGDLKLDKPSTEEKDGYTSYWYDCPMLPGYDMPAVTLNDNIYVYGSSKAYNYEVAKQAKPAATISPVVYGPLGLYAKMNIEPMLKAAKQWEQAAPAGKLSKVSALMEALNADLKGISYTVSKEDGKIYVRMNLDAK